MTTLSIIGLGGMAQAIAARAVVAGHSVELIGRDPEKTQGLAAGLGAAVSAGTYGAAPTGDLVLLAVPYPAAVQVVAAYGEALAGKVIVDISNTSNGDATALSTPEGTSGAQQISEAAPVSAHVVKAFNTVFGHVLARGGSLDVLLAGDDQRAKDDVSAFVESLGLRPLDAGGLQLSRWLEGIGVVMISLARDGIGNFDFSLGVDLVGKEEN